MKPCACLYISQLVHSLKSYSFQACELLDTGTFLAVISMHVRCMHACQPHCICRYNEVGMQVCNMLHAFKVIFQNKLLSLCRCVMEIAVVYYRSGYMPDDYPTEKL